MSKFCTNCGAELADGAVFCTECGTKLAPAEPQPEPVPTADPAPVPVESPAPAMAEPASAVPATPAPAPAYPAPNPYQTQEPYQQPYTAQPAASAPPAKENKPVSTIGFMLLQLLYVIPVVGFICSLVLAIAPRNKNVRHHALANFLWKIILLVLFVYGCIKAKPHVEAAWDKLNQSIAETTGGQGINSLDDLLQGLQDGSLEGYFNQIGE